jgi:hypothetical protein
MKTYEGGPMRVASTLLFILFSVLLGHAEEGMWTFDNPPRAILKERYGFEATEAWLDHLRLSSVRFGGGSGSFVSANGLVITNHHVGRGQIQKLSTREKDYVAHGFYARTPAEELKCPDLELNVLMSFEDVTPRVLGAVKPGMTGMEALDARKKAIAEITKESREKTNLRSDVVSLYQGSQDWLYRYKKYTDVRLVMCPEAKIAFYGGDPDNFTFPRHDIDVTFFRVYEDGKPAATANYLKWNSAGAEDAELVFVSGHPGSTNRLQTLAQTLFQRDVVYPVRQKSTKRKIDLFKAYAATGAEEKRRAGNTLFGLENSYKVGKGEYQGLLDPRLIAAKQKEEEDLRGRIETNPEWNRTYRWAWDTVAAVVERQRATHLLSTYRTIKSTLYGFAQTLVEYSVEMKKPDNERLTGFQDAHIASTRLRLFSPAPIYLDMEEIQLADGLKESREYLGAQDPYSAAALGTDTPEDVARKLTASTTLVDPEVRRRLFEGGESAITASDDPMIVFARRLYPIAEEMRVWNERNISAPLTKASQVIGSARFTVYGKTMPPDATGTLRLSYGTVKGYPMNGTMAPPQTTFHGLFDRAHSFNYKDPYDLPDRYLERKASLAMETPLNFVSTCDIIGGNSGSPVVNRNGEFVGIVFDGNIESLTGRFVYTDEASRAVSVHSAAIIEALRKIYDAAALADELEGKRTQ